MAALDQVPPWRFDPKGPEILGLQPRILTKQCINHDKALRSPSESVRSLRDLGCGKRHHQPQLLRAAARLRLVHPEAAITLHQAQQSLAAGRDRLPVQQHLHLLVGAHAGGALGDREALAVQLVRLKVEEVVAVARPGLRRRLKIQAHLSASLKPAFTKLEPPLAAASTAFFHRNS